MSERDRTHYADAETIIHLAHLTDENKRLRQALTELYEATHGYLNQTNGRGRMRAGTLRLNTALGDAAKALHPER